MLFLRIFAIIYLGVLAVVLPVSLAEPVLAILVAAVVTLVTMAVGFLVVHLRGRFAGGRGKRPRP